MNEKMMEKLELLKVMKDLNGQGFRLNSEINAVIKNILHDINVTKASLNENDKVNIIDKFESGISKNAEKQGKVVVVDKSHRGVGKTTSLIKASLAYDVPIVVGRKVDADYISIVSMNNNYADSPVVYTVQHMNGRRIDNGVLVDESVQFKDYKDISPNIIRGGYCSSEILY